MAESPASDSQCFVATEGNQATQPDLAGIKVVASDLDGTFLDPSHAAPAANLEALSALEAAGIPVVIATGRARASAQQRLPSLNLCARPGVFLNGAVAYDATGSVVREVCVQEALVADILRFVEAARRGGRCSVVLCRGDEVFAAEPSEPWSQHLHEEYGDPEPQNLGGYGAATQAAGGGSGHKANVVHVLASGDEFAAGLRAEVEAVVAGRARAVMSLQTCFTLQPLECSKADGLSAVLKDLGSSMSQLLAIGDSENDVEMLAQAAVGVAMANASDSAKASARWATVVGNGASPPGVALVFRAVAAAVAPVVLAASSEA